MLTPPEKKQIITLAGRPGAGKTTTRNLAADELGFERHSTGGWFRDISHERGLDLLAGNEHAQTDRSIDIEIDRRQKELGLTSDRFVIDGRLAWHFIPNSYKVYLDLDPATAARRVLADPSADRAEKEKVSSDPDAYAKDLQRRRELEAERYMDLYGVDISDMDNYDLVIDTSNVPPEEVARLVVNGFRRWFSH
jgi:cytidylate kinase